MDKVIVERPRQGSRDATGDPKGHERRFRGKYDDADQYTDLENMPSKQPMNRYNRTKNFNEHLRPLYRFLDKQVGRPWDKVYSEICEGIKISSTVQRHILQHVFDHVAERVFVGEDDIMMVHYSYGQPRPLYDSHWPLYVHPVDGLLKKVKKPKNWKSVWDGRWTRGGWTKKKREEAVANGPDWVCKSCSRFFKVKGIWYVARLSPIFFPLTDENTFKKPDGTEETIRVPNVNGMVRDAMLGRQLYDLFDEAKGVDIPVMRLIRVEKDGKADFDFYDETLTGLYGKKGVYAESYKQANSKELKRAGLKNDPQEVEE